MASTTTTEDRVTVSLPRAALRELLSNVASFAKRMHYLLEQNTDGLLSPAEQFELEAMIASATISQILANASGMDVED